MNNNTTNSETNEAEAINKRLLATELLLLFLSLPPKQLLKLLRTNKNNKYLRKDYLSKHTFDDVKTAFEETLYSAKELFIHDLNNM